MCLDSVFLQSMPIFQVLQMTTLGSLRARLSSWRCLLHQPLPSLGDVNVVQPNYSAAARDFLRTFRSGLLGPVMLDRDILQGCLSANMDL